MIWKVWKESTQKPPLGAQINWASWAAKKLVGMFLINEYAGAICIDIASGKTTTINSSANVYRVNDYIYSNNEGSPLTGFVPGNVTFTDGCAYTLISTCIYTRWGILESCSALGGWISPSILRIGNPDNIFNWEYTCSDATTQTVSISRWFTTNVKYHFAATADSDYGRIYINGVEQGNTNHAKPLKSRSTWYPIGGPWNGQFTKSYNASLYNTALTADQIAQLYREPYGNQLFEVHTGARIFISVAPVTIEPPAATGTAEVLTPSVEIGLANTPTTATGTAEVPAPQVKIIKKASEILFINPGGGV